MDKIINHYEEHVGGILCKSHFYSPSFLFSTAVNNGSLVTLTVLVTLIVLHRLNMLIPFNLKIFLFKKTLDQYTLFTLVLTRNLQKIYDTSIH